MQHVNFNRLSVSWKAGAKVRDLPIQGKYIGKFFKEKYKFICKGLKERPVLKQDYGERKGKEGKGHIIIIYKGEYLENKEGGFIGEGGESLYWERTARQFQISPGDMGKGFSGGTRINV